MKQFLLIIISFNIALSSENPPIPILIWHSALEHCCGDEINSYSNIIKSQLGNDTYIKSVRIGNTPEEDRILSLTSHPSKQIDQVCREIRNDERFVNGYYGLGLSQGGLFMRGLVQRCPYPRMKNLITLASPHQGVFSYPQCSNYFGPLCGTVHFFIKNFLYTSFAQRQVTPAAYWHDPHNEQAYLKSSTFLSDINNDKEINPDYIENLANLNKFVIVKYLDDESIIPNESVHFGYIIDGRPVEMEDTPNYIEDRLGLRALKERGCLVMLTTPGKHLELNPNWFVENIVPYLTENENY